MSRILILGGYGGFGGRIARRLASAGHDVLVAGRSLAKAQAFCADKPRLTPIAIDRASVATALSEHRPALLVDASGPFQTLDHMVPAACIEAGIHYVDIADAREFVCDIAKLDAAAKAAGVAVISGASSVPALSGAVVRRLAYGFEGVRAIEMAISASNRAPAGPAVAGAILAQIGQPLKLWRGRRWTERSGWQELRREHFAVAGDRPLGLRLVALVDVPDHGLLPDRLPGRPAVTFRAGTELGFQTCMLWLASWLVRWNLLSSLAPMARLLRPLQGLTGWMGSDRSAMIVRLFGIIDGRRVERRWTLIASKGDGPEIPALSVPPLVSRILDGLEPAGARDAGSSLDLADYQPAFDGLAIRHEVTEHILSASLYARVMGTRFAQLPHAVRAMHEVLRDGGASGFAEVTGPTNFLTAAIASVIGFPRAGTHELHVAFEERDGTETWTRTFGSKSFHSRLSQKGDLLVERFGAFRFGFDLSSDEDGLTMVMRRWWIGPFRLPLALAPRSLAREWEENGRFHFDVPIALPILGRVVHYRGQFQKT